MKKVVTTLLCVLFVGTFTTHAQPFFEEDFSFSGGLTSNSWSAHSGAATNALSTTTGLTYAGYNGSGQGNAVLVSNLGGEDVNQGFTEQNVNGTEIFLSAMVNVTEAASSKTGDYFMHLGDRTGPTSFTNFVTRVFVKVTSDVVNFGISHSGTASYAGSPTSFSKNTTYLLVIKHTINTGGNDDVKLWIFSSGIPATEIDAGTPEHTVTGVTNDIVDAVGIRQGNASNSVQIVVDGIRIGNLWNDTALPVEITSFTGNAKGKVVELAWQTATEVNNHGFEIERAGKGGTFEKIGFVAGNGNSNSSKNYSFIDATANPKGAGGKVVYRLKQIDNDGAFEYHGNVEMMISQMPQKLALMQNYPNSFNPTTNIQYSLPNAQFVTLKVYDMLGKEIATLVNGMQEAGNQQATFTASNYPSGMYFYTLRTNNFTSTKKMLLVK